MGIIKINEDNASDYSSYIGDDMAENMCRYYYRGLIALDRNEDPVAGIIWELVNMESNKPTESHIKWFKADEEDGAAELFDAYKYNITENEVKKSYFAIPVDIGGKEKKLLKDNGFTVRLTESDDIVSSLRELSEIPLIKKKAPPKNVEAISRMTIRNFRNNIARCIEIGKKGACEDLQFLPMAYFDIDVSCYVQGSNGVSGMMLFHETPSGLVSISLMVAFDQDFAKTLPAMMRFFVSKMLETHSPDTRIHFSRHNQPAFLLSEKLLPRGFGTPVYAGERDEG